MTKNELRNFTKSIFQDNIKNNGLEKLSTANTSNIIDKPIGNKQDFVQQQKHSNKQNGLLI